VSYKIQITNSIEELSEFFARLLIDRVNNSTGDFHLALSGGSTPKIIFEYLAAHHQNTILWDNVKFYWGDERCVPPTDPQSNYKMAHDSFLSKLHISTHNIFRIKGEDEARQEVDRYSSVILLQLKDDFPRFDLIMLGLGEDGHTASIFPNQKSLLTSDKICATAVHPGTGQARITLTGKVINNAANVVFIATGKGKSKIIDAIINKKDNFKDYPASFINPKEGQLYWLLDKDAASLLHS